MAGCQNVAGCGEPRDKTRASHFHRRIRSVGAPRGKVCNALVPWAAQTQRAAFVAREVCRFIWLMT